MIKTSQFFHELRLRHDAHVADFGSGIGADTKILPEMVPEGKVFALEIVKQDLETLEEEAKKQNLKNVVPVWGDVEELEGTRLRDDSVEAVVISNIFYLLQHKKTCVLEVKRILKKKGKVLLVDWFRHLGDSTLHKSVILKKEDVMQMFEDSGFGVYPVLFESDYQFALLMEKK